VIRVRGLRKEYAGGARALDDVNLEIGAGEFVALIGPSGAGKSSLLRCLNGMVVPTGMYFLRVSSEEFNASQKIMLMK